MLYKIFPKTNELTVFVVAVVLYATVISNIDLISLLKDKVTFLWLNWLADFSNSNSIFTDVKLVFGLIFLVIAGLSYLIGPLLMPFTKKDIRRLSLIILWIDVSLIIYWNIKYIEPGQWFRLFPIIYGSAWFIYSIVILKMNERKGIDQLVTEEQTNPNIALKWAGIAAGLSLVLNHLFNLWWLDAYMLAIFITLILEGTFSKQLIGLKTK